MANNTRQYSIVINGVEQSVKAVDALLQKIDALDEKITKLQKLNIDLAAVQNSVNNAGGGGSRYDAAKSEAAAQKEVTDQIALQNAENQKALQLLVQKKNETKEQVKIQQQIAQGVRDTNGEYANTLNGQRALLSEMKKQIGNMDIDDAGTRAFAEQINQVTEKIKEMEEAYGVFQRNVGNYKSAAEGFEGFNVTIGETVRNFGSLREAAKTIKNEMMGIDTSTQEGQMQFEAYSQALHDVTVAQAQMADAADRAASSSKGLHDTLEMMEGLTAVAGIGQGISSLFGLDDSGLGEQITKLQSLMTIMQSIKTLQDQMERGVGGGGWIAKLWKGLDNPIASLKKLSAGLKTAKTDTLALGTAGTTGAAGMTALSVATTTATVALKAFAKATVILFVLQLLAEAVDLLIEGFKKLGSWIMSLFSDSDNAANAIENVGKSAEQAADALDAYNDQLSRKVQSGMITTMEEFADAMAKLRTELGATTHDLVKWFNSMDEDFQGDANGLSLTKTADDAIDNLKRVGYAFDDMDQAADDFDEKLAHHGRNIVKEMAEMGMQSREELAKFIEALESDKWGRTALKQMMDELPEESRQAFQAMLDNFYDMANQMANRAAQLRGEMISMVQGITDAYNNMFDKSQAIHDKYERQRQKLREGFSTIGSGLEASQFSDSMAKLDAMEQQELANLKKHENNKTTITKNGHASRLKATKSAGRSRVTAAKDIASQLEAVEKRIQQDKIAAMRDGLGKTLAQLDLEKRNRIEQAEKLKELGKKGEEAYNKEILSITELYAKKEYDAKKKWADEWFEYQKQLDRQTEQISRAYADLVIKRLSNTNQNWLDKEMMDNEILTIEKLVRRVTRADEEIQKIVEESGVKELLEKYLKNPTEEVLQEVNDILEKFEIEVQSYDMGDGLKLSFFDMADKDEYKKSLDRINELKKEIASMDLNTVIEEESEDISELHEENLERLQEIQEELEEMEIDDENIEQIEEYIDRIEELEEEISEMPSLSEGENVDDAVGPYDEVLDKLRELEEEMGKLYDSIDISRMALSTPGYLFHEWQMYYDRLYNKQKEYAEKVRDLRLEEIGNETSNALFDENEEYDKAYKDIEKKYEQHLEDMRALQSQEVKDKREELFEILDTYGEESDEYAEIYEEYAEIAADEIELMAEKNSKLEYLTEIHNLTIKRIEENGNEERLKAQNDYIRESQTATANYYSGLLNEWNVFQNKFLQQVDKLSDKSKNAWGILDMNKFSEGIYNLKAHFLRAVDDIKEAQMEMIIKLANNEISLGDFNTAYNELESLREEAEETLNTLNDMSKNKIGAFIESINQYIQAVGQGVTELLQSIWDAQSASFDAQQEALEKANSELEKQLSKQQQITQRHADKINDIESELDTARGDRRQHLIDSLSAQIAAQRASLAAEQRIQKQKEANEKKQDELAKKRKEAQRKQDLISAAISTALATANGLATQPFVPVGIAMGALAAALGAAQIAIIASKHYAKGGLLEGPSHARGGIPVGNTGIEVEGKEYIVNKNSTAKNLGLIEYINRSNKRLDMADLMEYFNSAASTNVKGVRSKFADGGVLPELNDNIEVVNPSQTVIFNQDDRPIYVTVRDINNAQENYRNVQVLAGLK